MQKLLGTGRLAAILLAAGCAANATTPPAGLPAMDMQALLGDAAARAGTTAANVEVQAAEALTWSDGALGCPKPGMVYTQALVHGHRVVLRANGRTWPYHIAHGRWLLCGGAGPIAVGPLPSGRARNSGSGAPAL